MIHSYDPTRFQNNKLLINYIERNLGGINNILDFQINAFKAYWLIMAVFHEMKCGRGINESARYIKQAIKKEGSLIGIKIQGLPLTAKGYILLLRLHLFRFTLLLTKMMIRRRERV